MPFPYTPEDARGWLALAAVERERGTGLHLVVVRTEDDQVVGATGLHLRDEPELHGETGYWVARDARRAGIAARAVALVTGFALDGMSLPYMEIVISPANEPSLAVARRCGYTERRRELREFKGKLEEFAIWRRDAALEVQRKRPEV